MVASGVAGQNGSVAIRTGLVGTQNLPFQRVGNVYKFRLVEFNKRHIQLIFFQYNGRPAR